MPSTEEGGEGVKRAGDREGEAVELPDSEAEGTSLDGSVEGVALGEVLVVGCRILSVLGVRAEEKVGGGIEGVGDALPVGLPPTTRPSLLPEALGVYFFRDPEGKGDGVPPACVNEAPGLPVTEVVGERVGVGVAARGREGVPLPLLLPLPLPLGDPETLHGEDAVPPPPKEIEAL